ncbi:MAG: DUF177 domain-containing protein [Angelakisella sp.]
MKLDINRILDREGEADVVTANVGLSDFSYRGVSPFQAPVSLTVNAENRAGVVTLDCTYCYTLHLSCDRCLTPFTLEVKQQLLHTVLRSLNGRDDDDFVVVPDGIVELDELATNDIILSLPGKFLCKEDCKGLCPICGCNLNTESCGCQQKQADPRLAALDQFFEE